MAEINTSNIDDAKRRVWEMRERAKNIVDDDTYTSNENESTNTENNEEQNNSQTHQTKSGGKKGNVGGLFDGLLSGIFSNLSGTNRKDGEDNNFALILAMILVLSREGADNMLILALLYILL